MKQLEFEIINLYNKSFNQNDKVDKQENIKGINGIDVLQVSQFPLGLSPSTADPLFLRRAPSFN